MEHLIRVVNERDRQLLEWLREQVGEKRLEAAAYRLSSDDRPKPYVSAVCRYLGLKPPSLRALPAQRARYAVADHYLAVMRESLSRKRVD
jgi:hypothetical protein